MKKLSGIYKIFNFISNDFYIGSSVDIQDRWYNHKGLLNSQLHPNIHLQRAWNKYGIDSFRFEILRYCEPKKLILLKEEQFYLDVLKPQYNVLKIAGSTLGNKFSSEARLKMGIKAKERWNNPVIREKIIDAQTKAQNRPEIKQKKSENAKKLWTTERKDKQSKRIKGTTKSEKEKIQQSIYKKLYWDTHNEEKIKASIRMSKQRTNPVIDHLGNKFNSPYQFGLFYHLNGITFFKWLNSPIKLQKHYKLLNIQKCKKTRSQLGFKFIGQNDEVNMKYSQF